MVQGRKRTEQLKEGIDMNKDYLIYKLSDEVKTSCKIDNELFTRYGVKRGLRNEDGSGVLVGLTNIGNVVGYERGKDGQLYPTEGKLFYRGYELDDLVSPLLKEKRFGFEEIAFLLLSGSLPDKEELAAFKELLNDNMPLDHRTIVHIIDLEGSNIMNILARCVLEMYTFDPNPDDYGSNATVNQNYNVGFKKDKFDFGAFYGSMNTHGWKDYDASVIGSGKEEGYDSDAEGNAIIGKRGSKKVLNESFGFNMGYSFNDSQKLTYKYTHSIYDWKYDDPISYIEGPDRWNGEIGENNKSYSPSSFLGKRGWRAYNLHSLTYNDKDNGIHAHFGLTDYYKDGYITPDKTVNPAKDFDGKGKKTSYPSKSWNMDLNKRWALGAHNLLAGVSYGQDKFNETISSVTDWKSWNSSGTVDQKAGGKDKYWSLYAQDKWNFAPKWTAYIGGRYDHYRKYGGYDSKIYAGKEDLSSGKSYEKFSPKLSLDYAANRDTNFYLSYGKSFNTPILYQLFRYSNFMGRNIYPNKDLEPETTDTWELGMKQKIGSKTDIHADVFYAKTKDYIRLNDSDKKHEFYENAGDAKTHGFEISLNQHHSDAWTSYINYTWQTGKVEGEKNYDIPRHLLHVGTTYSKNPWTVNLDGMFISDRTEAGEESGHFKARDAYFLMNLSTNYQFNKNFGLQFAVNNLFDREYYDEDISNNHYYIGDGRTYTLTARYSF